MTTIFPSVIFQQQVNCVSTRHIQPRRPRRVRLRLDALRLRRRQRPEMTRAAAAPGQPVRPGRLRLRRRRRGDRVLAAGLRAASRSTARSPSSAAPTSQRHRPHGHRDADPRHVRLLARGDGGREATRRSRTPPSTSRRSRLVSSMPTYASARRLAADWDVWPEFFIDDCVLPAAAARELRARPAARDAVVREQGHAEGPRLRHHARRCSTIPYYQRHVVGTPIIGRADGPRDRERRRTTPCSARG